jgi:hypothetical protein
LASTANGGQAEQKLQSSVYRSPAKDIINGKLFRLGGSASTFLCLGKPTYAHPELQIKSKAKQNLQLREGVEFANLSKRVETFCKNSYVDDLLYGKKREAAAKKVASAKAAHVVAAVAAATAASSSAPGSGIMVDNQAASHHVERGATTTNVAASASAGADAAGIAVRDAAYAARDAALLDRTGKQIQAALQLDLEQRPRMTRSGQKEITLHNRKIAGETERNRVLKIIYLWGYNRPIQH